MDVTEKHWLVASHMLPPNRDATCHLGMCPDQELNPQSVGVWDDAPINWATQTGLYLHEFKTPFFPERKIPSD